MKERGLALLMALMLFAMCVPANAVYQSEKSRDGLWTYDWYSKTILGYHGDAETITIPEAIDGHTMTIIGSSVFNGRTNLKTVKLSRYIKKIGGGAFANCINLETVKGAGKAVAVGMQAFQNCTSLKNIDFIIDPEEIGSRAFENCTSLTSFTFPEDMKKVGDWAFKGCTGLQTIQLPRYVDLGDAVFAGCTGLDGIWAHPNSRSCCNDEYGVLFDKDKTKLLAAPGGLIGTYVVPDTVKQISRYAFWGCNKLETVIIPDTVTHMGLESFQYCTALHTAVLSGYYTTQSGQFKGCSALDTVVLWGTISKETYADCGNLKSIFCYNVRTDHNYSAFNNVTATMYYYEPNANMSQQELQAYQLGGDLTWVPLQNICVAKGDGSTYSVGSDLGAIFFMMAPKEKLSSVYVDGVKLTQEQYMPMTYGTTVILKDSYLQTLSLGTHKLKLNYIGGSCEATFTLTDEPVCRHEVTQKKAKEPTCTKDGNTAGSYCKKCDKVFDQWQVIPALGHEYKVTTVAPTCTEAGYDLHTCRRCGNTKKDNEITALGHDFITTTVPPTCTEGGCDRSACSRCDYGFENNETAPRGHMFGEWEIVRQPTVEMDGVEIRKCLHCEIKHERLIEKLPQPSPEPPVETEPSEPPTTAPAETEPVPTRPDTQAGNEPANLVPWIIVGAVLLVAAAAGMVCLFRKKS